MLEDNYRFNPKHSDRQIDQSKQTMIRHRKMLRRIMVYFVSH